MALLEDGTVSLNHSLFLRFRLAGGDGGQEGKSLARVSSWPKREGVGGRGESKGLAQGGERHCFIGGAFPLNQNLDFTFGLRRVGEDRWVRVWMRVR